MALADTGEIHHVLEIPRGLDDENRPVFEGLTIYRGGRPLSQRIKDKYEPYCVTCDDEGYCGIHRAAVTDYRLFGLRLYRSVDSVTFMCLSCLHEYDPETYPYASIHEAYGGDGCEH